MRKFPVTLFVALVSLILTVLATEVPAVLTVMERSPAAVENHEWWRLITAALVNRGGWGEITGNLIALIVVGAFAESIWSGNWWLAFFGVGAFTGEIAGLVWKPVGAGASVAVCGLLGGIAAWLWWNKRYFAARLGSIVVLAGGIALVVLRNLHGPPLLAGFGVGAALLLRARQKMAGGVA